VMLDMLLSCSIALALATLVVVLSARESIEFSAFPSLLLVTTLFRLSLNVASTRLILLKGDAGRIIDTFGNFVVGGNLIVGLVVFLILVVIQFVVITKGAERISEVAARFNLDAMPGKQMAIDADLSAGLINEQQARQRREKIVRESEFYGAMDGASKFIRGDAVAGLIITAVNLVGGFIIGTTGGMTLGEAIKTYSILTVGDGLVTQIPALIISTSAGLLISKTSSKENVSHDLFKQMFAKSRPLGIASFLLAAAVFVPGFPKLPFVVLSLAAGLACRALGLHERNQAQNAARKAAKKAEPEPIEELLDVDRISIQVGSGLIRTVDPRRKGSVSHRISPLRRKFAQEYGLVLPLVRLRDSVTLEPDAYEIRLYNHVISSGRIKPDKYLAMDSGTVRQKVPGEETQEPVFNLPALWIDPSQKEQAELNGYTVVDPETVLITHLAESLKRHAHELLSRDDVQVLVNRLRRKEPALVAPDRRDPGRLRRPYQGRAGTDRDGPQGAGQDDHGAAHGQPGTNLSRYVRSDRRVRSLRRTRRRRCGASIASAGARQGYGAGLQDSRELEAGDRGRQAERRIALRSATSRGAGQVAVAPGTAAAGTGVRRNSGRNAYRPGGDDFVFDSSGRRAARRARGGATRDCGIEQGEADIRNNRDRGLLRPGGDRYRLRCQAAAMRAAGAGRRCGALRGGDAGR